MRLITKRKKNLAHCLQPPHVKTLEFAESEADLFERGLKTVKTEVKGWTSLIGYTHIVR